MVVLQFLIAMLSTACLASMAVYMLLAGLGRSAVLFSISLPDMKFSFPQLIIMTLGAIGLFVSIFQGAEAMLYWLPTEWGFVDEDGEYIPYRRHFAILYAVAAIGWMIFISKANYYYEMYNILEKEVDEQGRILTAIAEPAELQSLADEYHQKVADLQQEREEAGRLKRVEQARSRERPILTHPDEEEERMYRRLISKVEARL